MESLKSVITNIIPEFAGTIVEHVGYPFQVNNKLRDLEKLTRDLVAMKEDAKTAIESAERKNGTPTKQVLEWLRKVEVIEKEADNIKENSRKRRRSIWLNYATSKCAAKKFREVKSLCDQKTTIENFVYLPPPLAQEMPISSSKSSNLEATLHSIKDDMYGIIGIWGMGGVGKTHLLKQVNNELSKDVAFKVVVFVTCSKECYEEKVQDEIIDKLKLNKIGSMEQKKIAIYSFLKQHNFVILLDDLWSHVDLETIGIPNPNLTDGTYKRKVVLTTRSTEVCGQMEVRKKIRVNVLKWDDAWSLFKEKVTEETINSDPLIQRCAVDVAKELGGLPLALITIGRAMHDKIDPCEWEQAIDLLKKAKLCDVEFSSTNGSVFSILKFSFDSLKNDTLKQCFLHCSLWPEDHLIQKRDLVELWMGLGLIDEPNIYAIYNVGCSIIRRLQAVCLLETIDDDYYTIKMHDVIRDMALWIASNQGAQKNKWIVQAGTFGFFSEIEVSLSHDTEKLSLMYNFTKKVSLYPTYSPTKLSTLLLQRNKVYDTKPLQLELFSELTVLDLSRNDFEAFPIEICKLIHLQYLELSYNSALKSLPKEFEALTSLKYLFLRETNMCTIPKGILLKLKALRVLELNNNYHVTEKEDNYLRIFASLEEELQCLPHFQALGISISNMDDFQKLSQTSVPIRWLTLTRVEEDNLSFSSYFLENSLIYNNLVSLNLSSENVKWVTFERTSRDQSIYHLGRLENLLFGMFEMKEIVWMSLDPKDVFSRLQVLQFWFCIQLTSISWVARLPCIRELIVWKCKFIEQLIYINELNKDGFMVCQPSFSFLKKMTLHHNLHLERISDSTISFPVLDILEVDICNKLRKLPFKTNNPPKRLKLVGTQEWWDNIELDDITHRSLLQPYFSKSR